MSSPMLVVRPGSELDDEQRFPHGTLLLIPMHHAETGEPAHMLGIIIRDEHVDPDGIVDPHVLVVVRLDREEGSEYPIMIKNDGSIDSSGGWDDV